jgi:hypothetical protein
VHTSCKPRTHSLISVAPIPWLGPVEASRKSDWSMMSSTLFSAASSLCLSADVVVFVVAVVGPLSFCTTCKILFSRASRAEIPRPVNRNRADEFPPAAEEAGSFAALRTNGVLAATGWGGPLSGIPPPSPPLAALVGSVVVVIVAVSLNGTGPRGSDDTPLDCVSAEEESEPLNRSDSPSTNAN